MDRNLDISIISAIVLYDNGRFIQPSPGRMAFASIGRTQYSDTPVRIGDACTGRNGLEAGARSRRMPAAWIIPGTSGNKIDDTRGRVAWLYHGIRSKRA